MRNKNNKINVMISIAGLHHGGAERVVAALCNNIDRERFSVSVCWRMGPGAIGEELISQGHELIGLPELDPNMSAYSRFLVLGKLLREKDIDILHTHDTGSLADAAQCRLLGARAKLVHTFHYGNYPHLKGSHRIMEMLFGRLAHRLVAVGYEQKRRICKALHFSESSVDTIYNGVEEIRESQEADVVAPYRDRVGNPVIIGSISTLTEQKGLTHLLDTADILHRNKVNCIFLIAGDGPLRGELEEKCRRLGLEDMVHFLGWVPNAAVNLLSSIDIFCQSSLWEANSIVLLEAMAAGTPIVTTNVGESRHVIAEGYSGYVVEPGNPAAIAEALEKLVMNPVYRDEMGQAARQVFIEKYTVDKMTDGYMRMYESLM